MCLVKNIPSTCESDRGCWWFVGFLKVWHHSSLLFTWQNNIFISQGTHPYKWQAHTSGNNWINVPFSCARLCICKHFSILCQDSVTYSTKPQCLHSVKLTYTCKYILFKNASYIILTSGQPVLVQIFTWLAALRNLILI